MEQPLDIKTARLTLGLTQTALAAEIGADQGTVSAWESGKHQPSKTARKAIERLLKDHPSAEVSS